MNELVLGERGIPYDPHHANVQAKKGWNGFMRARLLEIIRPAKLKLGKFSAKLAAFCSH